MARLAFPEIWRVSELVVVIILMTVCAGVEFDLVQSGRSGGNVTLGAFHRGMLPNQRVSGRVVINRSELDLLESFHGVTRFAFAAIGALSELAAVRVFVAIAAEPEGKDFGEFSAFVTGFALHLEVFADERIRRLRVIEFRGGGRGLPSGSRMATLAALLEESTVRVRVTG